MDTLKLSDFDCGLLDPREARSLSVLLESVRAEAGVTVFGSFLLRQEIELAITTLTAAKTVRSEVSARVACIVGGRPRTGTTLLHNLLGLHPDLRALRGWEALAPFDPVEGLRRAKSRREIAARMAPSLTTLHKPAVGEPEESNVLTSATFSSWQFPAILRIPGYTDWLRDQDFGPVHVWTERALHHLDPCGMWIIKSPFYSIDYPAMRAQWPNALVVEIDRDIHAVKASWGRLVTSARGVYSANPVGPGDDWAALWTADRSADGPTLRFKYEKFVDDPMATCGTILGELGLPASRNYVDAVDQFLANDPLRT